MSDVFEDYKRAQTKFGLPEFKLLQDMFQFPEDFSDIDQVRNEMCNKLFDFSEKVIEPLIWCNGTCHMIEKSMINEGENTELFEMFKRMQALRWRNHLVTLKNDKNETVKLIRDMWFLWHDVEPRMSRMCKKFSDGWLTLKFKKEKSEYHG